MTTPTTRTTTARARTDTERRAVLYHALAQYPNNARLRDLLLQLTTPRHIRLAAHAGIYISYARHDELFALELALNLRTHGLTSWFDMLDVGEDWEEDIDDAMKACGLMLMVVSQREDEDLVTEGQHFMALGKIVVPVIHEQSTRSFAPYLPYVDFRFSRSLGLQTLLRLLK